MKIAQVFTSSRPDEDTDITDADYGPSADFDDGGEAHVAPLVG